MKKLLLPLLVFTLATGCKQTSEFDSSNIVASFGIVSDVHVEVPPTDSHDKFRSALEQLKATAAIDDKDGIDGVLVCGDLLNQTHYVENDMIEAKMFKDIYESVLDPQEVPLVYTIGNHDVLEEWNSKTIERAKKISDVFGEEYFKTDLDQEIRQEKECRHCVIDGIHILTICPSSIEPVHYPEGAIEWLDGQLAEITASDPDRFVLVMTHPMIYHTIYGSYIEDSYWYTEDLTETLSKYPQAIVFGGHLHFPLNDQKSIWQGDFTVLGCGSVRFMAIEPGRYEYMRTSGSMLDRYEFSQGLLAQFDKNGNVRFTRMDFHNGASIREPWIISHPAKDNSHLAKYNQETLKAANAAPSVSSISWARNDNGDYVVSFPSGTDDEFVHHYAVKVLKDGNEIMEKRLLADFYRHPQPSDMKAEWSLLIGPMEPGEYELKLIAYDSWDAASEPAVAKVIAE